VLANLAQNAAQAIPSDRTGVVRLEGETTDQGVVIRIVDNGCGIPEKDRERIFEPLFTTKSAGTGFGLSIVRGIVHRHQGMLSLESELGVGTTFSIRLPRVLPGSGR
jgi:signal transduction histidine kinase